VTASAHPSRAGTRLDLILGSALAVGLFLVGVLGAGGTELTANTWVQTVLVGLALCVGIAVLLKGAKGPRWGLGAVIAFTGLATLTYASIGWSVQPASSWLEANRTVSYLATFALGLGLARLVPRRWTALLGAVAVATSAICGYALLLKIFPGALDPNEQLGRLIEPLDYWNAIGLIAAMGIPACLWAGTRAQGPRWSKALTPPAIAILTAALVLSYSRGSLIVGLAGAACWFLVVPLRLRGALVLGVGAAGGGVISGWSLASHALSADYVPLSQRIAAGRWLGLMALLVLAACGLTGWLAAGRMERVVLSPAARRRVTLGLIGLVALLPVGGIGALAASSRGLTGEVSHIWSSLTNTRGGTGDQPGRLVELSNSRPHYWSEALTVGGHHLFAGTGAGGFATANLRYTQDVQPVGHAHSYLVETFADFGLLGLAVSLALLAAWGIAAARPLRAPPRAGVSAERFGMLTLGCVVLVFGLHSLIDWTWFIPATAVLGTICAGWLAGRGPLAAPVGTIGVRRRLSASPLVGLAVVTVVAATVFLVWVVVQPMRSAQADSAAISALLRGDAGTALTDARSAVAANPVSAEPLYLLSRIYAAKREPAQARTELRQATTLQPANPQTWLELGTYDLAQRRPAAAVAELQRAQQLRPASERIAAALRKARIEYSKTQAPAP
jgi:hypothetical protein